MRLVDVDELKKQMCNECFGGNCGYRCYEWTLMNNAPTVDPVKHGHWKVNDNHHTCRCSCCESMELVDWALDQAKYCPHCGAKMDEVEDI